MKIAIVGYKGRFGSVLSKILEEHEIIRVDKGDDINKSIRESELAFLSVPASEGIKIIKNCSEKEKIVEVSSIKRPFFEFRKKIISIHPLFGPRTYNDEKFRNIVFIDDISIDGSMDIIREIFKGFRIIVMNSEEHDKFISEQLVLPYILSVVAKNVSKDNNILTGSKRILEDLKGIAESESPIVLRETIGLNKHSMEKFREIEKEIKYLLEVIK